MPVQFNRMPTYTDPLLQKGQTSRGWYNYWQALWSGSPGGAVAAVTPTPSPFTYTAPSGGVVIIQGGSVTSVSFSRDGVTNYSTGQTQGMFPVSQGDSLIIAYSSAPNITFAPR